MLLLAFYALQFFLIRLNQKQSFVLNQYIPKFDSEKLHIHTSLGERLELSSYLLLKTKIAKLAANAKVSLLENFQKQVLSASNFVTILFKLANLVHFIFAWIK